MEDQLVSYEVSKLAKKKGFAEEVDNYYTLDGNLDYQVEDSGCNEREYCFDHTMFKDDWNSKYYNPASYSAPTQSLLQRWLREVHKIHIKVDNGINDGAWNYFLVELDPTKEGKARRNTHPFTKHSSYEEVLEVALKTALNLLPDK